ncbi:MAG: energy-coupled thiamine transporter ThiT, partial [Actinobacteria bacterium]
MARRHTVVLVEAALTIALCAVLGMFKVWEMPQGGSASLG